MDSMRSLNTSLPRTTPRRQPAGHQTSEDILSAFKAAALSVTTLYRAAANDQIRSRAAGYQDALDDLLSFLDKENIGLGDGEGWRIRRWATERLDGTERTEHDDEEDDIVHEETRQRHHSPEQSKDVNAERQTERVSQPHTQQQAHSTSSEHADSSLAATEHNQQQASTPPAFVFRSSHATYPTNHDREVNMDATSDTTDNEPQQDAQSEVPMRVELVPKSRNRQNRNNSSRSGTGRGTLGAGAGSKRRVPFDDFFNISGLNFDTSGKDGSDRGGKRGRHV